MIKKSLKNQVLAVTIAVLLSFTFLAPSQSQGIIKADITWQLVVISSDNACSGYHHYMVEKYNEIAQEYLNLYMLDHGNYKPQCYTDDEFSKDYQKPIDLDLLILVFDKDKGLADLHAHNTGGIYIHQGSDLTRNHTVIICDCPNFKYSDPVWILSHELSHFALNYLGFDLNVVEEEIHGLDYKFDRCVEVNYDTLCTSVKTKLNTNRADWTVMTPYSPAIGLDSPKYESDEVSLDTPFKAKMIKELTNWWIAKEISDENYLNALQILSGKEVGEDISFSGVFQSADVLILAEPKNDIENGTITAENEASLTKDFLALNNAIVEDMSSFSPSEEGLLLDLLESKAVALRDSQIDEDEFISEIEWVLDTPKTGLYLKYLENLSSEQLISRAIEAEKVGEYRNAISYYDRALLESVDSNEIETKALEGKGAALNALGHYEIAIEYFDRALESEPNNSNLLKKKAFSLAQLGELEEAAIYYKNATKFRVQ